MKNLDTEKLTIEQAQKDLGEALEAGDQKKAEAAVAMMAQVHQQQMMSEVDDRVKEQVKQALETNDQSILAQRGVRQLTTEETTFYQKVIGALTSSNPKQQLDNLEVTFPETVINQVFEDLTVNHPLLNAISFTPVGLVTRWLVNKHEQQLAVWGELCDEIIKEIVSAFDDMDMSLYKLSAFMIVCNAMLDLGPVWLDRYCREILYDALACGLEQAIVDGDGDKKPIGMMREADDSMRQGNVYPRKAEVSLADFSPGSYGGFIADNLSKTAKGNPRVVGELLMVVNPTDYLKIVMPATTVQTPTGAYVNNVFPHPTRIVQSVFMPEGKAVFGLGSRYFMGLGRTTPKAGRLEYSDEYRFLEDQRTYRIKLYGNGRPLDNNSFVVVDISGIPALAWPVRVVNASEFPGGVNEGGTPEI